MALALDLPDGGAVLFQGRAWTTLTDREHRTRRVACDCDSRAPLSDSVRSRTLSPR